jgi:hypothetical protein
MTMDRMMSGLDDFDDGFDDEYVLDEDADEEAADEEDRWPRPEWLPADCRNAGFALEVATCCKNPDNPLVACAVDLADLVDLALGRLVGFNCVSPAAELGYRLKLIPGLLAQIHAILPRLNPTALAQLICPIGRLANAVDQACLYGCPWACGDSDIPDRRSEFGQLGPLLSDCLSALRDRLGWPLPERWLPVVAVDDLVEGAAVWALDRRQRPVGRIAQRDQVRAELVVGEAEQAARHVLVPDARVGGADAKAGRGEHDAHRGLAEVVLDEASFPVVLRYRGDQRDRRRRVGDMPGALPDVRQLQQLRPLPDQDEVPGLPVLRGRRPAAGLEDLVQVIVGDRPVVEGTHVPPRPNRIPSVHAGSLTDPAPRAQARPSASAAAWALARDAPEVAR